MKLLRIKKAAWESENAVSKETVSFLAQRQATKAMIPLRALYGKRKLAAAT